MLDMNSFIFRDMAKPKGKHESKLNDEISLQFFFVMFIEISFKKATLRLRYMLTILF